MATATAERAHIDIDHLVESENPMGLELAEKLEARQEASRVVSETTKVRKGLDAEIVDLMEGYGVDEVHYQGAAFRLTPSKSRAGWDTSYLQTVLTPEQLERAYKKAEPTGSNYVKVGKV